MAGLASRGAIEITAGHRHGAIPWYRKACDHGYRRACMELFVDFDIAK